MSTQLDLGKRLRFFGIDSKTKSDIKDFLPFFLPNIEAISKDFYAFTMKFPDARRVLASHYKDGSLKDRQIKHWTRLFMCKLDGEYLAYALKIGRIHFEQKVSPYLYIGGYNFIQCRLTELASTHYPDAKIRSDVLIAINRLIALDMEIALSAYTREYWLHDTTPEKKINPPKANTDSRPVETMSIC